MTTGLAWRRPHLFHRFWHAVVLTADLRLSSNYTLYGDLSARVMTTLADYGRNQEVYSIDECFLDVTGDLGSAATMATARAQVLRDVGIPTSVGIGPTKTLAGRCSPRWMTRWDEVLAVD